MESEVPLMVQKMILLGFLALLLFCLLSCGGPLYGELKGMKIYVTRGQDSVARGAAPSDTLRYMTAAENDGTRIPGDYYCPKDVSIAFNKVWFPEEEAYQAIRNLDDDAISVSEDNDCLFMRDRTVIPSKGYFKPIDTFTRVTASTSQAYSPDALPEYGMTYYGVLVDMVYYEYEMEDFTIRWYVQNHTDDEGAFECKDVLLKGPTTAGAWKFPYYHLDTEGDLTFILADTRKEVSPGNLMNSTPSTPLYFCITSDGMEDGPGGKGDAWEPFLHPMLIAGHATPANPNPLDSPHTIEIFTADENEAQYYLFQMSLNCSSNVAEGRFNGFHMSPGIHTPQRDDDPLTYADFLEVITTNLTDTDNTIRDPLDCYPDDTGWIYTEVSPIGSGMDTRFGYIDFEDRPQGEFSPGAGW